MSQYKVIIDQQEFDLREEALSLLDIIETGNHQFHILHQGCSFSAKILKTDFANKKLTIEINGNPYQLLIEDELDQLVKKMGLSSGKAKKIKNIKAPMPGLVLNVMASPGQKISKGDSLLILEAMKMENVLKAEGDGVIKSIEVNKGMVVDKGQILVELE